MKNCLSQKSSLGLLACYSFLHFEDFYLFINFTFCLMKSIIIIYCNLLFNATILLCEHFFFGKIQRRKNFICLSILDNQLKILLIQFPCFQKLVSNTQRYVILLDGILRWKKKIAEVKEIKAPKVNFLMN